MNTNSSQIPLPTLHKVPVYEVRLVRARRPLRIAEPMVSDGQLAAKTMHAMLGLTDREHLAVLFLNGRHQVTGAHVVAIGGQHGIGTIEPRTLFRAAIAACASALVLGHNHPSGDPTPSSQDLSTTAAMMKAGLILGIPILDHVIVTRDSHRWHSMLDRGTLPDPGIEA
jgi:DNA repair protein RadC